jgi:hypothetical protein
MARPDAVTLSLVARQTRALAVTVGTVVVAHRGRGTGMQCLHRPSPEAGGEQQQKERNQSSTLESGHHGLKLGGPPVRAKGSVGPWPAAVITY